MTTSIGSSAAHTILVQQVLQRIGALHYVRVFPRVVGLFYIVRKNERGQVIHAQPVKVGIEGEPDLDCILRTSSLKGIRLGLECKTGSSTQSPEQKAYQNMIESMGGFYFVVRTADEALAICERLHLT